MGMSAAQSFFEQPCNGKLRWVFNKSDVPVFLNIFYILFSELNTLLRVSLFPIIVLLVYYFITITRKFISKNLMEKINLNGVQYWSNRKRFC